MAGWSLWLTEVTTWSPLQSLYNGAIGSGRYEEGIRNGYFNAGLLLSPSQSSLGMKTAVQGGKLNGLNEGVLLHGALVRALKGSPSHAPRSVCHMKPHLVC